jgi:triphosphoribosyl-dephospho-CoA synthetase
MARSSSVPRHHYQPTHEQRQELLNARAEMHKRTRVRQARLEAERFERECLALDWSPSQAADLAAIHLDMTLKGLQ